MALVPHKVVALNEFNDSEKQTIEGAVVSLYDTEGNAVTLFDSDAGANGSTAKQTDAEGVVVVYVTPGEYDEEVNGGIQRRVLIGNEDVTTQQLIERIRKAREGDVITTTGFYTAGDGGGAQWRATGETGLTASQHPAELEAAELVSGTGRKWELASDTANIDVAILGGGISDDYGVLLAAARASSNGVVTVNISMSPSQDNQYEFANTAFIGSGSIDGLYRKGVINIRDQRIEPPELAIAPIGALSQINKSNPKVVLVGDSISTYAANTRNRKYMLAGILEDKLNRELGDIEFYDRAIGGATYLQLDGISTRASQVDWYTDVNRPWLEYIEELQPDMVVISFGMNDTSNIKYSAITSVISKIRAWNSVPSIALCTTLVPSLDGANDDTYATKTQQEGRDFAAGLVRSYANYNRLCLLDFNRQDNIARDGMDVCLGRIGQSEEISSGETLCTGGKECYNFRAEIIFDESSLSDGGYLELSLDYQDSSKVRLINSGGEYRLTHLVGDAGGTLSTVKIIDTGEPVGTENNARIAVEVGSDSVTAYRFDTASQSEFIAPFASTKVIRGGGMLTPYVISTVSNMVDRVRFDYSNPFISMPAINDRLLWADNSETSGIKTWDGSGWNHPSSHVSQFVYVPVLEQFRLSNPDNLACKVSDFVGGSATIEPNGTSGAGAPYGHNVNMPADTNSTASFIVNKSGAYTGAILKYYSDNSAGTDMYYGAVKSDGDSFLALRVEVATLDNTGGVKSANLEFSFSPEKERHFSEGDTIGIFRNAQDSSDTYGDLKIISIDLY